MNSNFEDLEPFDPCDTFKLEVWCRRYQSRAGQHPPIRLLVGLYQLHQQYKAQALDYSPSAAFVLHTLMAAQGAGANPFVRLPDDLRLVPEFRPYDPGAVLSSLAEAAQQIIYIATCKPGTARYGRIDLSALNNSAARAAYALIGFIPREHRRAAFEEEIERLETYEWKSK